MLGVTEIVSLCAAGLLLSAAGVLYVKSRMLEKKLKDRDILLKTTAHDLRSPLASVKGYADALLDGTVPECERENALSIISLEADRLARLSSRLTEDDNAYTLNKSVFDVTEILYRIKLALDGKAKREGAALICSEPSLLYVEADSDAIYESLYNICDNAIKYSDGENRTVWLCAQNKGGKIEVTVSNTGKEIPNGDVQRLFDYSYRGKSAVGSGSGLGLYIAQKLVAAHGSTINIASADGINSFYFTLDAAPENI